MVVRLAEKGCLLDHLKKNRENPYVNVQENNFTHIDKMRIARDVAKGMLHLATKKVQQITKRTFVKSEHSKSG